MTDTVTPPHQRHYSDRALPPYAYIPGQTPRPGRGQDNRFPEGFEGNPAFPHGRWYDSDEYRYGIDLLNFGFWWESHEVFEKLWHVVGPRSSEGNFFQALIQLAAAQLKRRMGNNAAAKRLASKAVDRLTKAPLTYMGMNVGKLIQDVASPGFIAQGDNIRIQLNLPDKGRREGENQNPAATS
ncbi:MAG: DUF309 domain-containing protein [Nitrospiraceae bacterium]